MKSRSICDCRDEPKANATAAWVRVLDMLKTLYVEQQGQDGIKKT